MPYRQQAYDPADLLHRVTSVATVPVLVAGAVSTAAQIEAIARAGAWGFTMGSALLAGRRDDPAGVARRVGEKLALCREVAARYGEPALQGGTVHATDL